MKNLLTSFCLLFLTLGYAQNSSESSLNQSTLEINSFAIKLEVDSAKDLEETFKIDDLKELMTLAKGNQEITLEINCNKGLKSKGTWSSVSYKIKGKTRNQEAFIESANKVRNAALAYYD